MKKKLFAILLSIVMVVGLLPTVAFAAENYNLYVNGEQFTSEKLSIACGEGTASYDPNTKTLTLNNATITNGGKSDESPKYGIRVVGDTDLTIKLSGTNSITLDNGGGIFADGSSDNYNIIGAGKLTIDVKWDALYTLNGNISISEGAELDIRSALGCGITSYNKGRISIDSAKVTVSSYYTAADAKELEVKNDSEVVLSASADEFNAVYMGDENGAGKIEITNSKVEATSYYPALFTEGNLTVNGGEVKCTSTADGAIWTKGDILIKGGAKVTTYSEYPMGGNGSFTVEEAEIDAKNTNVKNIPAIFDECVPAIADGYHLNYAKAVDSEGTEIDLISSGTQYFALYKNVHFITRAVYPVSFVVTPDGLTNVVVKVKGQEVTGAVSLEAGTYPVEVTADNCKAYSGNITITADTATHTQTIAMTYLPADYTKVDAAIAKAKALNRDEYKDFSPVDTAIDAVVRDKNITEQTEVDAMAKAIEDAIATLQYKEVDYIKIEVPFKLTVKKTGEMEPGKETFKFVVENFGAPTDYVLVQDTIETKGEKTYEGKFIFTIRENQAGNLSEGFVIRQVKGNAEGWTYDETKFYAIPMFADSYTNVAGWVFCKFDENGEPGYNNPIEEIGFTNSYSAKKPMTPPAPQNPELPQTGDTSNLALWIALLFVSGGAAIGTTVVSRKKKYNR